MTCAKYKRIVEGWGGGGLQRGLQVGPTVQDLRTGVTAGQLFKV